MFLNWPCHILVHYYSRIVKLLLVVSFGGHEQLFVRTMTRENLSAVQSEKKSPVWLMIRLGCLCCSTVPRNWFPQRRWQWICCRFGERIACEWEFSSLESWVFKSKDTHVIHIPRYTTEGFRGICGPFRQSPVGEALRHHSHFCHWWPQRKARHSVLVCLF